MKIVAKEARIRCEWTWKLWMFRNAEYSVAAHENENMAMINFDTVLCARAQEKMAAKPRNPQELLTSVPINYVRYYRKRFYVLHSQYASACMY